MIEPRPAGRGLRRRSSRILGIRLIETLCIAS
jgi:hypothetical protein